MHRQRGQFLLILLILLLVVGAGGFIRYQQIARVSNAKVFEMLRQQMQKDLLQGHIKHLGDDLGKGDLGAMADRVFSMARQELVIGEISASRPLYRLSEFGETRFRIQYSVEENGKARGGGTRHLRYAYSPDRGWRYLGESDAEGFYLFYLVDQLLPDPA
jgi:cell division protein FtsB